MLIGKLEKEITLLLDWLKEAHEELNKSQAPNLSCSASITPTVAQGQEPESENRNLKEFNEIWQLSHAEQFDNARTVAGARICVE